MLNQSTSIYSGSPHKIVLVIFIKPKAISLFLFGSLVMSPSRTTQNGKIEGSEILLIWRYAFISPGVNNLHIRSCAFPRPALGSFPSTQPSCLLFHQIKFFPFFICNRKIRRYTPTTFLSILHCC